MPLKSTHQLAPRRSASLTAGRQSGSRRSPNGATINPTLPALPIGRSVALVAAVSSRMSAGGSNPSAAASGAAPF
ncbi:MAG: hypothetical protein DMG00_13730 [Acidobacteria bacterium]|nr:MAG: hypothetical protein DMG00_13730 [Acidobacteriota bacterium]